MAVAWFFSPYVRNDVNGHPARWVQIDRDFNAQIVADGGAWAETEILGNYAIVKVRASAATLTAINAGAGIVRCPKDALDIALSDLTSTQKTAIRNFITGTLGYPLAELQANLPADIGTVTCRQVLDFCRRRRNRPRYDAATDTIVLDGPTDTCAPLNIVDQAVQ